MRYNNQRWELDYICFIYIDSNKFIHIDEKHKKLEIEKSYSKKEESYRI